MKNPTPKDEGPIATPQEFMEWVRGLPSTRVPLQNGGARIYHSIDLATLAKDILQHPDLPSWWESKNMPPHLSGNVARSILALEPPEDIRAAIIFLML